MLGYSLVIIDGKCYQVSRTTQNEVQLTSYVSIDEDITIWLDNDVLKKDKTEISSITVNI